MHFFLFMSRSSRASRPRSGPFSELNGTASNILHPSSAGSSQQSDKKISTGLSEQPNGGQ